MIKNLENHTNIQGWLITTKAASNARWLLPERLKPIAGATTQSPSVAPIRATIEDYRTSTAAFIFNHSRVTKDLQDDGRWSETHICVYIYE